MDLLGAALPHPRLRGAGRRHRATPQAIDAALDHGLWQGLIESTNTKIRLLTRIAFGFRSPEALIALAMLALGGRRPALPGRTKHPRISQ
ncbi:transposase [Mycobacterium tuberculosis]|nr:transposase [Mycobacterium tuberculosis]